MEAEPHNESKDKEWSVNSYYIPVAEGRFLATSVNAGCKAARSVGLPLHRVTNESSMVC